jgi:TatD DNase family protein
MHCFPGGIEEARLFLRMGFLLGVGGTVTFPKSRLPDVLRRVGLDGVVLETDCPYLAPVPRRGRRNEPSYLRFVAERIASELGVSSSEVESATTENACRLFNLPVPPLADGGPSDALT